MVRFRNGGDGLQRLLNKKQTTRTRGASRFRTKKEGQVLTAIQKGRLQLERQERAVTLNQALRAARETVWNAAKQMHDELQTHSSEYFYRLIVQSSRITRGKRRTSRWNAFLSQEIQRRNANLPAGEERKRVSDGDQTREIAAEWKAMSQEDQIAATEETLKELEERREDLKKGTHTVPIREFHDARCTIDTMKKELQDLCSRTGVEAILFVSRSTTSSYVQPFSFATSSRLKEFVHATTKNTMNEFVMKMEGFCVSGMQGVANNYIQGLLNLKKETAALINSKLQLMPRAKGVINRMCYVNFDVRITERFGIVIDNWPLTKFCAPGEICSRPELDILISAWKSGAACFRSLDDEEWEEWKTKRLAGTSGTSSSVGGDAGEDQDGGDVVLGNAGGSTIAEAVNTTDTSTSISVIPEVPSAPSVPVMTPSAASTSPATNIPAPAIAPGPAPATARKRARVETSFVTVNVVTGPDGRSIATAKRGRKARSTGTKDADNAATGNPQPTKQSRKRASKKSKDQSAVAAA